MKLLLDENIPRQLKRDIVDHHEVFTVREKRWDGKLNGALLTLQSPVTLEAAREQVQWLKKNTKTKNKK